MQTATSAHGRATLAWGLAAATLGLCNGLLKWRLLQGAGRSEEVYAEAVAYGLAAFLLALPGLFLKAHRSWQGYFRIAAVLGALAVSSAMLR